MVSVRSHTPAELAVIAAFRYYATSARLLFTASVDIPDFFRHILHPAEGIPHRKSMYPSFTDIREAEIPFRIAAVYIYIPKLRDGRSSKAVKLDGHIYAADSIVRIG